MSDSVRKILSSNYAEMEMRIAANDERIASLTKEIERMQRVNDETRTLMAEIDAATAAIDNLEG